MLITKTFQIRRVATARATENTHAALVLTLAMPLDRIDPYDRGILLGFQDEDVRVTLEATDLVDPGEPRPMERLWSANGGAEERTRPGPTESCSECGRVIGDDEGADFYAPLAGPSRPVCGDCKQAIEDAGIAAEGADDEVTQFEEADGLILTLDAEGETVEGTDAPLGDAPFPERPPGAEPVTTPIRRGRSRGASSS